METSSRVDQSLERASRVLELTNVEAIAQSERQHLTAHLQSRRLPNFLMRWHKGADNLGFAGYYEAAKAILLVLVMMALKLPAWQVAVWSLGLCAAIALQAGLHLAAVKLSCGITWRERIVKIFLLPSRLLLPGYFVADLITKMVVDRRIAKLNKGDPLPDDQFKKLSCFIQRQPTSELVRVHAVAEIDKIKAEIVGSDSMLAKVEDELQDGLDLAEAMRLQVLHRLTRSEGPRKAALEQGMELAKKRVANLRKALSKHRDVMARARAILDECRVSAEGLGEAVEDSELLGKLEAGEIEDERKIALSELVMDQAVGQLRNRVMSLEGVLAQLEAPRCRVADAPQVEADDAYLGRIEHVAEQLAAI
ncbi:MAG: hypothetical protein WC551_05835 [Patescibacteria group bacterium]